MARTPQWIKKLGGHAGELFVSAELSKRAIPNALLPENFSDDDILVGSKDMSQVGFVQVKSCHPDRSQSFILHGSTEGWADLPSGSYCVFVWLGKTVTNEPPRYWIAEKFEVGRACIAHPAHNTTSWERRFFPDAVQNTIQLPPEWRDRWSLFDRFRPIASATMSSLHEEIIPTEMLPG